jgi:hypothetical protein
MDENPPEEDPRVGKRLDEANMRRILEENCHIVESGANKTYNEEIRDRINESEEMILKGIKIIRETDERILENLEYLDDYEAPHYGRNDAIGAFFNLTLATYNKMLLEHRLKTEQK